MIYVLQFLFLWLHHIWEILTSSLPKYWFVEITTVILEYQTETANLKRQGWWLSLTWLYIIFTHLALYNAYWSFPISGSPSIQTYVIFMHIVTCIAQVLATWLGCSLATWVIMIGVTDKTYLAVEIRVIVPPYITVSICLLLYV